VVQEELNQKIISLKVNVANFSNRSDYIHHPQHLLYLQNHDSDNGPCSYTKGQKDISYYLKKSRSNTNNNDGNYQR
jgi:hypothetical protein